MSFFFIYIFIYFFIILTLTMNRIFINISIILSPAIPVRKLEYLQARDFIIYFDGYFILFFHLFLKLLRWDFELLTQVHQMLCTFNPFSPMFLLRKQQYWMKKMKKNFILFSTISSTMSTTFPNSFHFEYFFPSIFSTIFTFPELIFIFIIKSQNNIKIKTNFQLSIP